MLKLMQNELQKMFVRKKFYVFLGILLVVTVVAGGAMNYVNEHGQNSPMMNQSGLSFPIIMFDGLGDMLAIFVVILVADLITEEYISGTLKLSLLRPVTRRRLLTAKLLVLALLVTMLLIFAMLTSYMVGIFFFGWGDEMVLGPLTLTPLEGILATVKGYLVMILPYAALGAVTMLAALFLQSVGSTIGIGLGFYFFFDIISKLSQELRPYLLATYFNYYQPVMMGEWKWIWTGLAVILVHGVGAYFLSLLVFQRKDLLY